MKNILIKISLEKKIQNSNTKLSLIAKSRKKSMLPRSKLPFFNTTHTNAGKLGNYATLCLSERVI